MPEPLLTRRLLYTLSCYTRTLPSAADILSPARLLALFHDAARAYFFIILSLYSGFLHHADACLLIPFSFDISVILV